MIYEYENSSGKRFEISMSIKAAIPEAVWVEDASDPGSSWVSITSPKGHPDEQVFRRVYTGGISAYVNPFDNQYPYVSSRLPKDMPGCRCTPEGKPIIESKKHEANIAAQHGYRRE